MGCPKSSTLLLLLINVKTNSLGIIDALLNIISWFATPSTLIKDSLYPPINHNVGKNNTKPPILEFIHVHTTHS